jgi:hypothetical protein
MKRNCILAACVLWVSFLSFAQSPAHAPAAAKVKYDEASRIKITGVVDDIQQRSLGGTCKAPGVFVTVKANEQTYELRVGPKWFVDTLTWTFTKGDKLEITGWKVDKEGSNEVVVRKINRAEWTLEPRDDSGAANWLWMPAPKDSGKCN